MLAIARIYETSQKGSGSIYSVNTYCAGLLLVLEQNFGLIAGNILPIATLSTRTTNNRRLRGKTPSHGDSTLSLNRLSSRMSDRRARPASSRTSVLDPNWSTKLYIEGGSQGSSGQPTGQDKDIASWSQETLDTQAWPRGIIKTVTIDVTEEDNPDMQLITQGQSITSSKMSVEQDWEAMLRRGPSLRYG
ncbi:hypothetical protein DL546_002533 [Coniochaeta pulveracea]|uniref:Uncharacterized protein n=1 Tax=Coniochaeta pulveracea TaxID=177199 RepID=A0A420YHG3_9PEZI|nr:hypothetical protein DL546_002533 [Coniochaeta pulveracea]